MLIWPMAMKDIPEVKKGSHVGYAKRNESHRYVDTIRVPMPLYSQSLQVRK